MTANKVFRILVVDDEESLRDIVSEVLTEEGHTITTAASAEDALVLFRKDPFPVVITDIRMAGMSGIELLGQLKKVSPTTQVIIMTSNASLETALKALREGAFDYLVKPFESLEAISKVVNGAIKKLSNSTQSNVLIEKLQGANKELEEVNKKLQEKSVRDGLTGLFNHRYFKDMLDKEIKRSSRHNRVFSLVFMDVDFFKKLNDTHGHQAGDHVLKKLGRILRNQIHESDVTARYGGEEFVLLLPDMSKSEGVREAEKLRKQIENHDFGIRNSKGERQAVTVSMGVASYPEDSIDPTELLKIADQALYSAKQSGRNQVKRA